MNAYELLEKSELGGIIEALQRLTTKQADRIADLEKQYATLQTQFDNLYEYANSGDEKQSEPVAWMSPDGKVSTTEGMLFHIPLYTTPQTKPLNDEEILEEYRQCYPDRLCFGRAIEAKVRGEK